MLADDADRWRDELLLSDVEKNFMCPPRRSAWRPHRAGLQGAERLSRTSAALGPNAVGQAWMRTTRKLIVGAMLALSPMGRERQQAAISR